MVGASGWPRADVWRKLAVYAVVVAVHLVLFAAVGRQPPVVTTGISPPIDLVLIRAASPPPPAEPEPARVPGGGDPAAPSRVRPATLPPADPPEIISPPAPASEPALVVGASPEPGPLAGQGRGGEGTGIGGGQGVGTGPGSGTVRARPIRQASMQEVRSLHPAPARGRTGRAAATCRVRTDSRLDQCRLTSESPAGLGFGAAALEAADRYYRFEPYRRDGRPVEGEITIIVEFGRPAR
jgi:periplasmic protein TonB